MACQWAAGGEGIPANWPHMRLPQHDGCGYRLQLALCAVFNAACGAAARNSGELVRVAALDWADAAHQGWLVGFKVRLDDFRRAFATREPIACIRYRRLAPAHA